MCCVIPPASVATTEVSRIASSSEVLPWSTWPMIVTTGGRAVRSSAESSKTSGSSSSSAACLIVISRSTSTAISSTSSSESDCVIWTMLPRPIMILMIWAARDPERLREVADGDARRDGDRTGRGDDLLLLALRRGVAPIARLARIRPVAAVDHDAALPPGRALAGPDRAVRLVGSSVSHSGSSVETCESRIDRDVAAAGRVRTPAGRCARSKQASRRQV